MSDIIIQTLEEVRKKGKLKRTDIIVRYLRMKYRLILTTVALEKRIKSLV